MQKLPPYVSIKDNTTYRYSRTYPIKIRQRLSQCPTKYDRSLKLKVGCSESELNHAVAREAKSYELKVKGLTVSDPNAYSQSEIEILASDILRRANIKDGEFSLMKDVEEALKKAEEAINPDGDIIHNMHKQFKEESGVVVVEDGMFGKREINYESGLTVKQLAEVKALRALLDINAQTVQTMDGLYDEYIKVKKLRVVDEEGKNIRATTCTDEFMSIIGNQETTNDINKKINKAMTLYRDKRIKDGNRRTGEPIKGQTITREMSHIMNFLNWINDTYDYEWGLKIPKVEHNPRKKKGIIEAAQQLQLVRYITSEERTKEERLLGCMILIYLHGGMMATEIKRFDLSLCLQDKENPYLFTASDAKNDFRAERLVPIVFQVSFIREHIKEAQEFIKLKGTDDMSRKCSDIMRTAINHETISPHWLRHTYKAMAEDAEIPESSVDMIAGWRGDEAKRSKSKKDYARNGLRKKLFVDKLFKHQKKTFHHLIDNQSEKVVNIFSG